MKAAVVHDFNEAPRVGEFRTPVAEPGETVVHVHAAAISQLVKAQASGKHYSSGKTLPVVPGVDGVGQLPDGSRVYFAFPRAPFGSMAQTTVVRQDYCVPVPDSVDNVTAAAMGNPGMSSWAALTERAHVERGETVLINGATGISGRLAIQIARYLGAGKIIATGRNAASVAGLVALGADIVVPLDAPHAELTETFRDVLHTHGIDIVLDYLWGPPAEALLHAASSHGSGEAERRLRFVQIGSMAGHTVSLPGGLLRSSGLELMGSGLGSVSNLDLLRAIGGVLRAAGTGALTIEADAVPLDEVTAAWNRGTAGRVVLTM